MVFVTRYLDLLWSWVSLYNFTMKLFFIGSSCYILYLMKLRFRYANHRSVLFASRLLRLNAQPNS